MSGSLPPHGLQHSRSLLKLMSIESVMPSDHLILCFLLPLLHPCRSTFVSASPKMSRVFRLGVSIQSLSLQFSSVQLLSHVQLLRPHGLQHQASLSIINSWSLPKLMSIDSVMPSNHLILCRPLLLPPSIFPSIRVFSNESVLHIRWPKVLEFQLQHQSFQ